MPPPLSKGATGLAAGVVGEAERYQRLRQQVGEALTVPRIIRGLIGLDQQLLDGKVEEASRHWQALRVRLLAAGRDTFTLQEELLHVTLLLEPKLRQHDLKTRALLETALELLDDPTHEQVIRGLVVQDAVRVGELQAAANWLEGLDRCSSNIHADSAYRIAAATLATARGAAEEIRLLLGDQLDSVPLAFEAQAPAAVLRAHAYELDGALQVAELQLSAALANSPPCLRERSGLNYTSVCHYRATVELPFALCPLTFERALSNVAPAMAGPAMTPLVHAHPKTTADMFAEALRLAAPSPPAREPPPAPRPCPADKIGLSAYVAILFGLLVVVCCVFLLTTMPVAALDLTSPGLPWNGWILDARGVRAKADLVAFTYAINMYEPSTYELEVRFEDEKGRSRTTKVTGVFEDEPEAGDRVDIEYDPRNRHRVRLAGTDPPSLDITLPISVGIGAVGLAVFLLGLISVLRQRRLYVTGTPAQARVLELSMGVELGGDNSSRPLWHVKYQYHAGGAVLTGTCRTLSAPPAKGSVMWILYDPKRPERSMSA